MMGVTRELSRAEGEWRNSYERLIPITQACKTKLFNRCFDFDN
jgi:hypothetical protein